MCKNGDLGLTYHVEILAMSGDSYRLKQSRARQKAKPH